MIKGVCQTAWQHVWLMLLGVFAYGFYRNVVEIDARDAAYLQELDFGDCKLEPMGIIGAFMWYVREMWVLLVNGTLQAIQILVRGVARMVR